MKLFLEISPLQEAHFTGVASVVASLAEQMLGDASIDAKFFYCRQIMPRNAVERVLRHRDGRQLRWLASQCALPVVAVDPDDPETVGLFPNVKTARRLFSVEGQIIHDLSFLLNPTFHTDEVIRFHLQYFVRDIATNDLNICVSEATRHDLLNYFPEVAPDTTYTMSLGAPTMNDERPDLTNVEPYVLVLGTLEPRKNLDVVLMFLRDYHRILNQFRFVFAGREGWGEGIEMKLARFGLVSFWNSGKILFPGFVDEAQKLALLKHARLVIYPSVFEGFGLPILEALALGTPVITTASTSLPSVSGKDGFYFDPDRPRSLADVFFGCLTMLEDNRHELRQRCREQAKAFSWPQSFASLKERLRDIVEERRSGSFETRAGPDKMVMRAGYPSMGVPRG